MSPRAVFARHDPERRLPHAHLEKLGTIRVRRVLYAIYYLDFSNPVSRHGQQRIAIIRNGTQFAGAWQCTLGKEVWARKLSIGKRRLTVRVLGQDSVIQFDEKGPGQSRYFCGEDTGREDTI